MPDAPVSLANNPSVTYANQIALTWSPGSFDGASPVLDYAVYSDQATGTWIEVTSGVTLEEYTVTGLTAD